MTQRVLAERMAYHPTRVSQVEAGDLPHADFARQADAILGADGALWELYTELADIRDQPPAPPARELSTTEFIAWLADHTAMDFAALYGAVCHSVERLENERPSVRHGRARARHAVTQAQLANALERYYGSDFLYRARVGGTDVTTGVVCRPDWLTATVDLRSGGEDFRYVPPAPPPLPSMSANAVTTAVDRLAGVEVNETVIVNNPLYRLLDVELTPGRLSATVTTIPFAHHALTAELMEGELIDALAAGPKPLPLRGAFLPTIEAVFDLESRACVGGAPCVLAIARSPRHSGRRDYVLLTQERSKAVLNPAGKLAVIPKAWHQPTGEPGDEAAISVTIQREFEEELLGRQDLEQIAQAGHPHVDILHAQQLTEPMAWLLDQDPDAYRVECTGLGINTLTSNYELPCLIVIEDETWWDRFGHLVAVNWEAERPPALVARHGRPRSAGERSPLGQREPVRAPAGSTPSRRGRRPSARRHPDHRPGGPMDRTWYVGNADDDAGETRSWLVGHFKASGEIRHSKDVEVKWAHHPEGDARTEWSPGIHEGTVLILVSGRWRLDLRANGRVETIVLERAGDYVVWGPGVDQSWRALDESLMVTVRWPSLLGE